MIKISKIIGILIAISLVLVVLGTVHASGPTYVLLVHGYNYTGGVNTGDWTSGVNLYQQLVSAGYIVGIVSYYGQFTISFSNGYTWTDPNFVGTQNTPIENISQELAYSINSITSEIGPMNLDIIAHSMGGLVVVDMLENYYLYNVNLNEVITIASPFGGSPLAAIAAYLGLDIFIGYQADEMQPGSTFLTSIQDNVGSMVTNYPSMNFIVYAGNYDPWWGYFFFSGDNDGVVSVNSATYIGYNYLYVFPDLHTSSLDWMTSSGVSYFEDQSVANTILANLAGSF